MTSHVKVSVCQAWNRNCKVLRPWSVVNKHCLHPAGLHPSGTSQNRHYLQLCKSPYGENSGFRFCRSTNSNLLIKPQRFNINIEKSANEGPNRVSTFRSACTNRPRHLALFSSLELKSCCMPAAAARAALHRPRALPAPGTTTQL